MMQTHFFAIFFFMMQTHHMLNKVILRQVHDANSYDSAKETVVVAVLVWIQNTYVYILSTQRIQWVCITCMMQTHLIRDANSLDSLSTEDVYTRVLYAMHTHLIRCITCGECNKHSHVRFVICVSRDSSLWTGMCVSWYFNQQVLVAACCDT